MNIVREENKKQTPKKKKKIKTTPQNKTKPKNILKICKNIQVGVLNHNSKKNCI